MGILDRFRKEVETKKIEPEEKASDVRIVETDPIEAKGISKQGLKAYKEWVYANVRARAKGVSSIKLELYKVKNDEPEEVKEHEVLETLNHANDFQSFRDLIDTTITHLDLTGESFWFVDRGGSDNEKQKPVAFWPLRPDMMTVVPGDMSKGEFISRYEYQIPGAEKITFAPWEILQFMYVDPSNPYRGMSVVNAAAQTIDTDNFAAEFNRRFFMNSARPDAILYTDQRLQNETLKRLRQTWNSKFRGSENSSKLAILESGLQYQQLQMSQKDMDFLDQQKWTRDKIMAIFGNVKPALAVVDDVNKANAGESIALWKEMTIRPLMQKIIDTLNEFLVPIYADDIFLSFKDPVPKDEKALVTELKDLTGLVYTPNEARALKGLPSIDGGDELQGRQSEVPAQRAIVNERLKDDVVKLKNRNLRRKKVIEAFEDRLESLAKQMIIKKKRVKKVKKDPESYSVKEAFHKQILSVSYDYEDKVKDIMINEVYPIILRETEETIRDKAKSIRIKDRKDRIKEFLFNKDEVETYVANSFEPVMGKIAREQGEQTLNYYDLNAQVDNEKINEFAAGASVAVAKSVTDTANKRIENAIRDKKTSQEMVTAAQKEVKNLEETQTEQTAISEVSRATNFGILTAFVSGGIRYKEWFTALDERVCPWCGEMEGRQIKVGERFFDKGDSLTAENENRTPVTLDINYGPIEYPPLHPSCRCTLSPAFTARGGNMTVTKRILDKEVDEDAKQQIVEEAKKAAQEVAGKIAEDTTAEDRVKLETTLTKINEALDGSETDREDTKGN